MFTTARLSTLTLVAATLLGSTAIGANPEKKATKAFKKALAGHRDSFRSTTKALSKVLDASLDVVDLKLVAGTASKFDVDAVFQALKDFQTDLGEELDVVADNLQSSLTDVQPILDDAGVGLDALPKGFYPGDGGLTDKHHHAILREIDDRLRAAENRVRKTANLFEKKIAVGINIRLSQPKNIRYWPGVTGSTFTALQHTISIAMSRSDLGVPDSGVVYLYGNCYSGDDLSVDTRHEFGGSQNVGVSKSGNSWQAIMTSKPSGRMVCRTEVSGLTGGGAYASIGIR